ncbi:hypothetical protein [Pedobacter caeni]|uniref:Uncharacterized protein n=1 Tax=Pedobacter caeni TaxID=288992 RepID=A0A1M5EEY3_9SPHI|nr:hypothetical protein [Pedobacter caeni]SHF77694.1 hypothetical protein SAMN04488522_103620 [Pedobacter caeni]
MKKNFQKLSLKPELFDAMKASEMKNVKGGITASETKASVTVIDTACYLCTVKITPKP